MKVGKANIIQGHNQNALAHRQWVRMEARGGDLQIVPSWKKKEGRTNTWKQKKKREGHWCIIIPMLNLCDPLYIQTCTHARRLTYCLQTWEPNNFVTHDYTEHVPMVHKSK